MRSLRRALNDYPSTRQFEGEGQNEIIAAAEELARDGTELIIVNGGDGTVQAVLTALLRSASWERFPLLAVLPGGTTNMIASDLGNRGRATKMLEHLLAIARSGRLDGAVVQRPVMRVEVEPGTEPIFSMFFGAGAIYHGIRLCRSRIHTLGIRGETGPGVALALFLMRIVLGQRRILLPPLNARGYLDNEPLASGALSGLLVTTLERLFLGLRPFWGRNPGPLKFSALAHAPRHVVRAAGSVMRGRPNRYVRPEFGYTSRNASEIRLYLDSGFTLDGELFEARPNQPVILRGGYHALFLHPSQG